MASLAHVVPAVRGCAVTPVSGVPRSLIVKTGVGERLSRFRDGAV